MKTLFLVSLSGSWFDSAGGIDYESSVSIDNEGKYNQEIADEYDGHKILSDSLIEKYSVYDGEENIEVSFWYKFNYMSSEFYCRKAPFTLMAKEIFNVIQMNHPDFHPVL